MNRHERLSGSTRRQGRIHHRRGAGAGPRARRPAGRRGRRHHRVDLAGELPAVRPLHLGDPGGPDETVRLVEATGRRILASAVDTRDHRRAARGRRRRRRELGRLDIIVANAGISAPQAWNEITPEAFRDVMDVNVTGTWNTVMAGAQKIIDGGRGGSIILISSAAGIKLQPFMVHYTASKHAVTGMARAFAAELGKHSIRVNSVHPGPVATDMGSRRHGRCVGQSRRDQPATVPYRDAVPARPGSRSRRTSPTRCAGWPRDESKYVTAAGDLG